MPLGETRFTTAITVMVQSEIKDTYQGIASAMPTRGYGQAALAAGGLSNGFGGCRFQTLRWPACLKACPDTNPFSGLHHDRNYLHIDKATTIEHNPCGFLGPI